MAGLTDEQKEIARTRSGLAESLARNFAAKHNVVNLGDDLQGVAYVALCKGVQDYDATKGASLDTYLTSRVNWAMLYALRKSMQLCHNDKLRPTPEKVTECPPERADIDDQVMHLMEGLCSRHAKALHCRYILKLTIKETAKALRVRTEECGPLINEALAAAKVFAAKTNHPQ
jgi:RNA polymerase sigma factor (sigma-70 family)